MNDRAGREVGRRPPLLWDPGAQPERTYQSWTRTGLATAVVALLLTRLAGRAGPGVLAVAAGAAVAAVVLVGVQRRRLLGGSLTAAPVPVAALTALTVALAVAGLLAVLTSAP